MILLFKKNDNGRLLDHAYTPWTKAKASLCMQYLTVSMRTVRCGLKFGDVTRTTSVQLLARGIYARVS
jgi:hypothetical protein